MRGRLRGKKNRDAKRMAASHTLSPPAARFSSIAMPTIQPRRSVSRRGSKHRMDLPMRRGFSTSTSNNLLEQGYDEDEIEEIQQEIRHAANIHWAKNPYVKDEHNGSMATCNGIVFEKQRAVNRPTRSSRWSDYRVRHVNGVSSGLGGRLLRHVLTVSLQVAMLEMSLYILISTVSFGLVYWGVGGCCAEEDHKFWYDVFFAFQTFTTIGYGGLSPDKDSFAVNTLVFIHGIHNLFVTTIFAGIVYTKFMRPRWHYIFARYATIHNWGDVPVLDIRIVNADGPLSELIDVTCSVWLLKDEASRNGEVFHMNYFLDLEARTLHRFHGSWNVRHYIVPGSPLFGMSHEDCKETHTTVHVCINGLDETTQETVVRVADFCAEDILFGYRFGNNVRNLEEFKSKLSNRNFDAVAEIDIGKISWVQPTDVYYPVAIQQRRRKDAEGKSISGLGEVEQLPEELVVDLHRQGTDLHPSSQGSSFLSQTSKSNDETPGMMFQH